MQKLFICVWKRLMSDSIHKRLFHEMAEEEN